MIWMTGRPWLWLALMLSVTSCPAMGPMGPPTDEQKAVVPFVLAQEKPAEEITGELIELLLSEDYYIPRFAAEALKERELTEQQMAHLRNIVRTVPFHRDVDCIRGYQWAGSDVSSVYAWDVLAHHTLRDLPADGQVQWLIEQMRYDRPFPGSLADRATKRLLEIGEPAAAALIVATEREGTWAQMWACRTLMQMGTDEAKAAVERWSLQALEAYDDPLFWTCAAGWLGRLHSEAAFEPLERMLWAHLEDSRVWASVDALVKVDPKRAVVPLAKVISEYEPDAVHPELIVAYLRAATALARMGDERGWDALQLAAASPMVGMRREAIFAAYATHDERARDILIGLTKDGDEQVASQADYWLAELDRALEAIEQRE